MTGPEPGSASGTDADSEEESVFEEDDDEPRHTARADPQNLTVEAPPVETAASLAAWWVSLADEQRVYDSHLLGEPNRALIREAIARHIVTDGLLVARVPRQGTGDTNARRATNRAAGAGESPIVGFVMFGPETGSYDQSVDRGIIENVYVHPDYRTRGVGGALLDAAERALAESGVDVIALEAMATNEAARRLYARRGYSPHRVELEAPIERLESVEQVGENDPNDDDSRGGTTSKRRPESDRKR